MLSFIKKHSLFLVFILLTVFSSFSSTWITIALTIPSLVSKILTVFVYSPFIAAIIWKLIDDISNLKTKKIDSLFLLYYIFAAYYGILTIYRFATGAEVKENMYYTLVLLGSIAIFSLIHSNRLSVTKESLCFDLVGIVIYLVLYWLWYYYIGSSTFLNQPINSNLLSGSLGLLLPFLLSVICDKNTPKYFVFISAVAAVLSIAIIVATGARAIFFLSAFTIVVILFCSLFSKKCFLRIFGVVACSVILVAILVATNSWNIRYALYRETGIAFSASSLADTTPSDVQETTNIASSESQSQVSTHVSTTDSSVSDPVTVAPPATDPPAAEPVTTAPPATDPPATEPVTTAPPTSNPVQDAALDQIGRSDYMRSVLVSWGMDEIYKNPFFGTGNVTFLYVLNAERAVEQSSHNFIIETIICYGLIGLVLLAALVSIIVIKTGIFSKDSASQWLYKISVGLTIIYYLALGLVQPTVYAPMICLLFMLLLNVHAKLFSKTDSNCEG